MRFTLRSLQVAVLLCSLLALVDVAAAGHSSRDRHAHSSRSRYKHRHASASASSHGAKPDEQPFNASQADPEVYTGATARPLPNPMPISALPINFSWCNTPEGRSFCGPSWNQHIPIYCGSCYVHGALHAANDRLSLLLDNKHTVQLARQVIINCAPSHGLGHGCDGGEVFDVFEYMHRYGLPDESCQNYLARPTHSDDPDRCEPIDICQNCMPTIEDEDVTKCWAVESPILYYVQEYGLVSGEEAMMNEIYRRGPITCAFASVDDFDYNYRGGIYIDSTNATDSNHDVEVVGWGVDPITGLKFWRARNSWGTYWGENSFFQIVRGVNNMRFEEECVFALFDVTDLEMVLTGRRRGGMFGVVDAPPSGITHVRFNDTNEEKHSWNDDGSNEHDDRELN